MAARSAQAGRHRRVIGMYRARRPGQHLCEEIAHSGRGACIRSGESSILTLGGADVERVVKAASGDSLDGRAWGRPATVRSQASAQLA